MNKDFKTIFYVNKVTALEEIDYIQGAELPFFKDDSVIFGNHIYKVYKIEWDIDGKRRNVYLNYDKSFEQEGESIE